MFHLQHNTLRKMVFTARTIHLGYSGGSLLYIHIVFVSNNFSPNVFLYKTILLSKLRYPSLARMIRAINTIGILHFFFLRKISLLTAAREQQILARTRNLFAKNNLICLF